MASSVLWSCITVLSVQLLGASWIKRPYPNHIRQNSLVVLVDQNCLRVINLVVNIIDLYIIDLHLNSTKSEFSEWPLLVSKLCHQNRLRSKLSAFYYMIFRSFAFERWLRLWAGSHAFYTPCGRLERPRLQRWRPWMLKQNQTSLNLMQNFGSCLQSNNINAVKCLAYHGANAAHEVLERIRNLDQDSLFDLSVCSGSLGQAVGGCEAFRSHDSSSRWLSWRTHDCFKLMQRFK